MISIEFYHDAVCSWCYLLSPRLRKVSKNFDIQITHRSFVLQKNRDEMIEKFGSMTIAKSEILSHWEICKSKAENPSTINVDGMRKAQFEYPSGYNAALISKAAESLWGQNAHWDLFDAIQIAHFSDNLNINDMSVLLSIADKKGFDIKALQKRVSSIEIKQDVANDNAQAKALAIPTIPTIVINSKQIISQALSEQQLQILFEPLTQHESTEKAL